MSFKDLKVAGWKAIDNFARKGYTPQLSTWPEVTFIDKKTKKEVVKNMADLIQEYEAENEAAKRERGRAKRQNSRGRR